MRSVVLALSLCALASARPVFRWQAGEGDPTHLLVSRDLADQDPKGALLLAGGAFLARGADEALLAACVASNELTLEIAFRSDRLDQRGPARILSFSNDAGHRNFTLGQEDDRLILRLRTPRTGPNGSNPQLSLCRVPFGRTRHVVVVHGGGRTCCYVDGERVFTSDEVAGGFSGWEPAHLLLGDEWDGERDWAGAVEGVAVYSRALTAPEIAARFQACKDSLGSKTSAPQTETRAMPPPAADPAPGDPRIRPYWRNPRYWQYKGQPLLLLGGSKDDNLFQIPDLEAHLDEIKAVGGNYIRNTMSDRKDTGHEVYPFLRLPDGTYDLGRWNEEYWRRFANLLRWTAERDIIVQIEVWDRFDYSTHQWPPHPYNPANNINYTQEESGLAPVYPKHAGSNEQPFFFSTPGQRHNRVLLPYQQRFVDRLLEIALPYDHVLYCMDNETSAEEAWGAYWAGHIRARAAEAGRKVCLTEMWDDWDLRAEQHARTLDHPERYDFGDVSQNNQKKGQEHWDNFQWIREHIARAPRPLNTVKTYGADSGRFGNGRDGIERWWRHLVGGAAAIRFHRPPAGQGLSAAAKASIRAARKLETLMRFWDLEPAAHLLVDCAPNQAFCAACPGESYALYFPDGGAARLDLAAAKGSFVVCWIDIATGEWGPEERVPGGRRVAIEAPDRGHWAAGLVREEQGE